MVQAIEFRDALKDFPSGVTVITSADESGTPIGATVSAFSSLSLDPPLILICLANWTRTAEAIRKSRSFVVNFLDESQGRLARHFAADIEDKFANVPYSLNDAGAPYLDDCRLRLECISRPNTAAATTRSSSAASRARFARTASSPSSLPAVAFSPWATSLSRLEPQG